MVIHRGIDVHSRTVVYLNCADNNRALTVLGCFMEAIVTYGVHNRVCTDRGGQNILVVNNILRHPKCGSGRGSFISGRSVHNSRIERLWRDLFQSCNINIFATWKKCKCRLQTLTIQQTSSDSVLLPLCIYIYPSPQSFQQAWNKHLMQSYPRSQALQMLQTEKNSLK